MAKDLQDMPKRIEIAYKDALDNLMFFKKQQWLVETYAMAAYAALFAVSKTVPTNEVGRALLTMAVIFVAVFAHYVFSGYEAALDKFRKRLTRIYNDYFTEAERKTIGLGQRKPDGVFIRGLKLLSAGAAIIVIIAIW